MILHNVTTITGNGPTNIHLKNDRPGPQGPNLFGNLQLDLDGALAFPGLVNSHDHLDFNLFPQLGNKLYSNYTEWGTDIHLHNKEGINKVLEVPEQLRTEWGMYKNLINGRTTVGNQS